MASYLKVIIKVYIFASHKTTIDMKKVLVSLAIAVFLAGVVRAQEAAAPVLLNYNTVKKKVEKSDGDIQDPKKNTKASTWFKRGELFQEVFELGLEQLQEGMSATTLTLFYQEPNSIESETEEDGSLRETYIYDHMTYTFVNGALQEWNRVDPICKDPLRESMDAYFKALELDESGKLGEKIKDNLINLKMQLKRDGVNDYYTGKYDEALQSFENVLEVNNLELFAGEMDTVMIQYSGIISREIAGKTDDKDLYLKAIDYYKKLADVDFGGYNTYLQIKMDYMAIRDTAAALDILKEGYEKYPDTVNMIANVADMYIQSKKIDEGIVFMEKAIERNPNIAESYYWNGRLLINKEEIEFIDRAIESYKKASELNPTIYYVWYDLGYIYYLEGADFYERANEEEHEATRNKLLELGEEKYDAAIPILEKAYSLNAENRDVRLETLDLLQRIYYKMQRMEDYERVKDLKSSI
jgi:tetratricopeptide (TPR) repeat protein